MKKKNGTASEKNVHLTKSWEVYPIEKKIGLQATRICTWQKDGKFIPFLNIHMWTFVSKHPLERPKNW